MKTLVTRWRSAGFGLSAAFLALTGNAMAAGTEAGTSVANTFTLDYEVNNVSQAQITNDGVGGNPAPTTFVVDRLVNLTVTSQGGTSVAVNEQDAQLVFSVRNDGNDNSSYALDFAHIAGDQFDAQNITFTIYVDDGAGGVPDGTFSPGTNPGQDGAGTAYTPGSGAATPDIAPDSILWVVLEGDIPNSVSAADTGAIALIADSLNPATSLDPNYTATPGNRTVAETGTNNVNGEAQNVLADGTGTAPNDGDNDGDGNGDNDGDHSDTGIYTVGAVALTANKTVTILATDGAAFGCSNFANTQINTSQYAAPGACVEYVITVSNGAGALTADNIDISDSLPDGIVFVDAQVADDFVSNGTLTEPAANCTPDSAATPTPEVCEVRIDDAVLNANETGTIQIRALVSST